MDNNLNSPNLSTTPIQEAAVTPVPQPESQTPPAPQPVPSTPITPNSPPEDSKKPILMLVIGAMIILALVGGIYLYLSSQQNNSKEQARIQATPSPTPQENLENDLEAIDVDSTGSGEFETLDQDLEQL